MTKGPVDKASIKESDVAKFEGAGGHGAPVLASGNKPGIEGCINIYDFEAIASRVCPEQGCVFIYFRSHCFACLLRAKVGYPYHPAAQQPRCTPCCCMCACLLLVS